jgi:CBS domain containing-hemolysin-like protein
VGDDAGQLETIVWAAAGGLLFLLDFGLSSFLAALGCVNRVTLHRVAGEGKPQHAWIATLREPISTHRISIQLLRQLSLLGGTLAVALAARSAGWSTPSMIGFVAGALVGVLVLETAVARVVAVWEPRGALRRLAPLGTLAHAAAWPVVRPLAAVLARVSRLQQPTEDEREEDQEEEVEAFFEVGEREGILEAEEGRMMRSIVDLDETRVREIMTPRPDIVALPLTATIDEARHCAVEDGHSRIPVYRGTVDEIVGMLHVRDLLRAWQDDQGGRTIEGLVREVMFVPETLSVRELLHDMRVQKHVAIVVDEYGGVSGLVTLEDLLEEIVGDIRDEHDEEEPLVRRDTDGSWIVDASTRVTELAELFGTEFEDGDFDTVGGLVVTEAGRVPAVGESLDIHDLRFTILDADVRRIHSLRVVPIPAQDELQARP